MFSIDGIVSGFDTTSIIEGLLQFQQTQLDVFNARKVEITTRQSAFGGIEGQLLSLRSALGKLNRSSSVFDATNATSSNEDILTVSADSSAFNASYSLTVSQLASAHQIGSQGFASETAEIGTGDFSVRVGNNDETTVQIDETNNTLEGLVTAINEQSGDVSASIVFDQAADSYRVLLTSSETGESNTISVTSNLAGGDSPTFDLANPVQAAQDAQVTLGSGPGAITASYSTNQIDGLISGVTIDLNSANENEAVTINVEADTGAVEEAIEDFVSAYNSVIDFIDAQTAFDPETNIASPLLGNRNVTRIKNNLLNSVIENVAGLDSGLSRLADIGVDIDTNGKLEIDSQRLQDALGGNIDGINPSDIRNLFGLNGSTTNSGIRFLVGSDNTVATDRLIEVDITQAAEQATVTATNSISDSIVITDANDDFSISFDSGETTVDFTIPEGTYNSREEFAAAVQSVVNNSSAEGAREISVTVENDRLTFTTEEYGSNAQLAKITGSALGFDGSEEDQGVDVAGKFYVDGVEQPETAVGRGRVLTSEETNAFTADIQLLVTLTPAEIDAGREAEITITRGITSQLDLFLDEVLDAENGTLNTINEEFDAQIESIDESIERIISITDARREALIAEFSALESILANLQNTGNLLASQLSTLSIAGNN